MEEYLKIKGKQFVEGAVKVSGSKNASLPLIAASLLTKGKVAFYNVPHIDDVYSFIEILKYLSCKVDFFGDRLLIDSSQFKYKDLTIKEVKSLRASYYLLGVLSGREKHIAINRVGGCSFSPRPIDMHIDLFSSLGIKVKREENLILEIDKLTQTNITFKRKSLGATINALLLMSQIEGRAIINNVSCEPEVDEIISFINQIGGKIKRENNSIFIEGVKEFKKETTYKVMNDRIEAGTFALMGAALGRILVAGAKKEHMQSIFDLFDKLDIKYSYQNNLLCVEKSQIDKDIEIDCDDYPSFPTDLKPILTVLLLTNKKKTLINDKIYSSRDQFAKELIKMGGNIACEGNKILIKPDSKLRQANIYASDLRASMGLIFASLLSDGEVIIHNMNSLHRGYENIYKKLNMLNVSIERGEE